MMLNNAVSLLSNFSTSLLNNSTNKYCSETFSLSQCYLTIWIRHFASILLAFSLIPQIIHLFNYRTRYIAGISYIWIIIRTLALTSLMVAHTLKWSSILEFIAIISTIIIYLQTIVFSNNLHRQSKVILIMISLVIWIIGGSILFFFIKQEKLLITIGYLLLAVHMLPQILLNSFLRTAKALSTFSIVLLAMSDMLLYFSISKNSISIINLISIYYSLIFCLFISLQSITYKDAHIHIISRSEHTVFTPGVDIFTGLDDKGIHNTGEDPQMFSVDDIESMNGSDVIYQSVVTNKPSNETIEQTPMKICVWYATLGWIFCIGIVATTILFYHIRSLWIIFVPISVPVILGSFFLLRTKLRVLHAESLRKIL